MGACTRFRGLLPCTCGHIASSEYAWPSFPFSPCCHVFSCLSSCLLSGHEDCGRVRRPVPHPHPHRRWAGMILGTRREASGKGVWLRCLLASVPVGFGACWLRCLLASVPGGFSACWLRCLWGLLNLGIRRPVPHPHPQRRWAGRILGTRREGPVLMDTQLQQHKHPHSEN